MLISLVRLVIAVSFLSTWGLQSVQAQDLIDPVKAAQSADDPKTKAFYQDLLDVHQKLAKASGLKLRLLIAEDDEVNAFATEQEGERWVVLNWGLIEALHDDRDAIAAVLAHEYAHHGKDHIKRSQSSNSVLGLLGAIAGVAINAKLGTSELGHTIGRTGAKVLSSSFSRDQEREADMQGLQWMISAGYNPLAAVRLQKKLLELAGSDDQFSLFRSHPPSKDRAAELGAVIEKDPAAKLLSTQPLVALNLPPEEEDDDEPAMVASSGTKTALAAPLAASLAPIQGFGLARYASFVNTIAAAPESEYDKVHAQFGLTQESAKPLHEAWTARMQQDPGLASAYGPAFFEASVGPFAQHGRDVAAYQRTGAPVAGDSPLPQADWLALLAVQSSLNKKGGDPKETAAAFAQATQAKGISPYDFQIATQWWLAVARQKAAQGDSSLMLKAVEAM
ncbi:MAG: hypothetical protein CFE43_13950 [Burkholderiales bacterium PBB3]|nr:MAG: hypothetical protein CFE43_13950 [Burkholderiales bacterium PBB3]